MSQTEIEPVAQATKIVSYDEAFGCVKTAVRKTALYFEDEKNTRGKVIMPCGSGKTLFSCFLVMRELMPQRTIITVPNLLLEEQSFRVFYSQLINEGYEFICVGSDKDIAQRLGEQIQVTTSSDKITAFLAKNENNKIIMLATYHSMKAICDSCQDIDFKFNLGIIDEAHRTVGGEDKMFSKILFDENIHIDKRLFMTATEKVYWGKKDEIIGMNNIAHYGETIYNYSLADAIEKDKILCDYEINEMYSTDDEVFEFIKSNSYLDYENIDLTDKDKQGLLCVLIATIKAIKEKGCRKIVTYHSKVKNATIFKELLDKIIGNKMLDVGAFHVNGINQSTRERRKNMKDFQSSFISVLTNSKALVEGIDMPCIDGIVYADKKESTIEIVQSVGRALRKYEGKHKCHIIIPILTSSKEELSFSNSDFSGLLSVLMQMSIQDERLLHELTSIVDGKNNSRVSNKILKSNILFHNRFKEELIRFNNTVQLRVVNKLNICWIKDKCIESAKKYNGKNEWRKNEGVYYRKARKMGWVEECCSHMLEIIKPIGYWTKERCLEDALKYKTRAEWQRTPKSSYSASFRRGWVNECCIHMKSFRNPKGYWTKERCVKDAKKYKTRIEWRKKSGKCYSSAHRRVWVDECCSHMKGMKKAQRWTKENTIKDALKYKTKKEWYNTCRSSYDKASINGWITECSKHMTEIIKPSGYWTRERCIEDAKKYKTRNEWKDTRKSGYASAMRNGWLDKCCKHMKK